MTDYRQKFIKLVYLLTKEQDRINDFLRPLHYLREGTKHKDFFEHSIFNNIYKEFNDDIMTIKHNLEHLPSNKCADHSENCKGECGDIMMTLSKQIHELKQQIRELHADNRLFKDLLHKKFQSN
jgi:hypothetical protein